MSRIGKKPVPIPKGVEVLIEGQVVSVKGKLAELKRDFHPAIGIQRDGDSLVLAPREGGGRQEKALWGLARTLLANMITGASEGFTKKLEIVGVGYRAAVEGKSLKLALGFSHGVEFAIPEGIKVTVEKNTSITVFGADREKIGQLCADIRRKRSPEPYKGKGVRYVDERIKRKEGKKK
ncbi:MAG: 50S ribosomal protein L6 [Magnetococcales bacterium]|nr:50S ribosomal protein L6 [Magnetococcales bacterium]